MGSGTEAAKEAGKIVILDDNFKSIKDAIWYGRTIYHNILKFCKFQLVINVAAVVVSAVAPFFGVEEPLKVTHLLFVNLVMDGLGAIMLGNEPAREHYMSEKPRRRDESIVSRSMMTQIVTMGIWTDRPELCLPERCPSSTSSSPQQSRSCPPTSSSSSGPPCSTGLMSGTRGLRFSRV